MKKVTESFWLTILGLGLLSGLTVGAMWFVTAKLTVAGVYWLVPIFGALGGAVGGLLRSGNAFELCSLREAQAVESSKDGEASGGQTYWKIYLGTVGEIAVGLGGATASVFLFGGTLKFEEHDPKSYVLLVSVSFLAGAFGKDVVVTAGERLLREVKTETKAARVEAQTAQFNANLATAIGYTNQATTLLSIGNSAEALKMTNLALELDPKNVNALGEKARALRRLNRLEEALQLVEDGLKLRSDKAGLLYNRACYRVLLGRGTREEILSDLQKAIAIKPMLKMEARKDADLKSLWELDEFKKMTADDPVSAAPVTSPVVNVPKLQ